MVAGWECDEQGRRHQNNRDQGSADNRPDPLALLQSKLKLVLTASYIHDGKMIPSCLESGKMPFFPSAVLA